MSASPYGMNIGRNCGQRGRVGNVHRKETQKWNAKKYVHEKDPMVWRKNAQDEVRYQKETQMVQDEPFQSRTQVIEQTRLKRKNKSFQDMCDKEYVKRVKKQEAKDQAKNFHKSLLYLTRQQEERKKKQMETENIQEQKRVEDNQMNTQ